LNNCTDLGRLKEFSFDYIFHHAAISDTRVIDQEIILRTNVNSFYDILNLAKTNNSVLIYASSAATYGSQISPQKVGNEKPENTYGYSKLMMDTIANKFTKKNPELKIIGLKFF
jgi:ADP-L-glycero-D-manno-heptose 6-epimerase